MFSLEPVDDFYRPIRHKEKTFKEWELEKKLSSREQKGLEIKDIPLAQLDLDKLENNEKGEVQIFSDKELKEISLFMPSATNKRSVIQTIF